MYPLYIAFAHNCVHWLQHIDGHMKPVISKILHSRVDHRLNGWRQWTPFFTLLIIAIILAT